MKASRFDITAAATFMDLTLPLHNYTRKLCSAGCFPHSGNVGVSVLSCPINCCTLFGQLAPLNQPQHLVVESVADAQVCNEHAMPDMRFT